MHTDATCFTVRTPCIPVFGYPDRQETRELCHPSQTLSTSLFYEIPRFEYQIITWQHDTLQFAHSLGHFPLLQKFLLGNLHQ